MCLESPAVCSPPIPLFFFYLPLYSTKLLSTSSISILLLLFSSSPGLLSSVCVSSPRVHDPAGLHRACPAPVAALAAARPPQTARVHQGTSHRGEETPVGRVKPGQRGQQPAGQSGGPLSGQTSLGVERGDVVKRQATFRKRLGLFLSVVYSFLV